MMRHPVIIKVGDTGAGKVGAVGAADYIRFVRRARPDFAPAAKGSDPAIADAAVAQDIFFGEFHRSG